MASGSGEGEKKLEGPDLATGVSADTLADGDKLLGHAKGEQVVLARVGDDFFAIGATCTHYGGPLAEGALVGDTVRCPWHHACFSLRNGEALRAPALNPVACWRVERRADRITVVEKVERDPLSPSYPDQYHDAALSKVVIVGGGAAGSAAAEMLRRCGFRGDVTVVDDDDGAPYDRPNLSKDYLAGNAPEEWIPIRPPGFYDQYRVVFVRGRATRIDPRLRVVHVEGRQPIPYEALILATGAEPVRLTIPGADQPQVHYLRTLRDSRSIIDAAGRATNAVVIGASFIGLEVAASLRTRNSKLSVHVLAPEVLPLERVMGRDLGQFIQSLHEEHGVVFHLQQTATRIDRDAVTLSNGERLAADLVVVGVGVRPRLQLAEDAGLRIENGVVVDEYLQTSVPGIYAAGDIARWPDPRSPKPIRVEHWVVAQRQGQTAARNVLGAREHFDQVPFFWSAHYDVSINYVGHAEKPDRVEVDGDAEKRDVAVRFISRENTAALATIFRDAESLEQEIEMERATPDNQ
jgi:NADPH-dependent 2,4-dienoyl-CoA reductase/sulfur reductase-like enzyme/nitrite reductase/ring-hydroxylating ferredoxin subunit